MKFFRNSPDIPEYLLQEHEDGNVVFFCGAGVSYPAKLPSFAILVKKIYKQLKISPNRLEQLAICTHQFDVAIGLLEKRIPGQRETVRKALASILMKPDLDSSNATKTHEALLKLGKTRMRVDYKPRMHLVTTNFDRLFEKVIDTKFPETRRFQAPLLPVPKNRWDGLVYLHGLLPEKQTKDDLDDLVVSSGDFGLAYLTERWAARFVSELFREFTVCFVGYSLNDPVLRYMMDALAADRLRGETPRKMFAFGSYSEEEKEEEIENWEAKNVIPLLYPEDCGHTHLHKMLFEWSDVYRDGARGKEQIVAKLAIAYPLVSTEEDDFIGRMLWALSDPSGSPAKHFAHLNPVPSLDWLVPLYKTHYDQDHLSRFGVVRKANADDKFNFSVISRPSPYSLAPWMKLVDTGAQRGGWDEVMQHLAFWLIRHLNDPKLFHWFCIQGGQLHDRFAWMVKRRLDELEGYERNMEADKMADIRKNAPNGVPDLSMRKLWNLMLAGCIKSQMHDLNMYDWYNRFKRDGLTVILRRELLKNLTPQILINNLIYSPTTSAIEMHDDEPRQINELINGQIVLSAGNIHDNIQKLSGDSQWKAVLPGLLPEFTSLLRDTLDLMRELGDADNKRDLSYIYQPSISEHPQNQKFDDWTALIDLVRDAWLAMNDQSPEQAAMEIERWRNIPYPLFRRLVFFAAVQDS